MSKELSERLAAKEEELADWESGAAKRRRDAEWERQRRQMKKLSPEERAQRRQDLTQLREQKQSELRAIEEELRVLASIREAPTPAPTPAPPPAPAADELTRRRQKGGQP